MFYILLFLFSIIVSPVHASGTRYIDSIFSDVSISKNIKYGNSNAHILDIYQPKDDTQPKRAAIIWVHGGSFSGGSKEIYSGNGYAQDYAKRGFVSIPMDYRLQNHNVTPGSPDIGAATQQAKSDVLTAVNWVKTHAQEYRIDPSKIIVGGNSAGAWTSLYVAYDNGGAPKNQIAAAISLSGGMSPHDLSVIEAGEPPAILLHGQQDTIVPIVLPRGVYNTLQSVHIPSEFHEYQTGHSLSGAGNIHSTIRAFLHTALKLSDTSSIPGDLDTNGSVNIIDFTLFMSAWWLNDLAKADLNSDGKINVIDYTIFMNYWYDYVT